MVPFIIMLIVLLVCRGLGALGLSIFATWQLATATALAVMFLFTASSHFTPMKEDLIKMVPRGWPYPRQIVFVTGLLELLGAIGLLLPVTRIAAGLCLAALLIAMFPANVNAALKHIPLRGKLPTPLWIRLPMQLIWIALLLWLVLTIH
jgi:uncharacterized membrane protein